MVFLSLSTFPRDATAPEAFLFLWRYVMTRSIRVRCRALIPTLLVALPWLGAPAAMSQEPKSADVSDDPYVWLEGVTDEKALDWVRARNDQAKQRIESDSQFD
jgi:hypothetical protein